MTEYNNKVYASIFYGSYLDTLGFYNGKWEFNYDFKNKIVTKDMAHTITSNIIQHYFVLGGININIKNWNSSDDTLLMMSIAKGCLDGGKEKDYIKHLLNNLEELKNKKRASGITTMQSLNKIKRTKNINSIEYSNKMGGNGAAIRSGPIGLILYREKDLDELIRQSIISSRITHNHVYGFLGGLVTALFTSYAIRNIKPTDWLDKLLDLYESKKIDKYMKTTNIYKKYQRDERTFWDKWYEYREKILNLESDRGSYTELYRLDKLLQFTPAVKLNSKELNYANYGSSGIGAIIIAYDALIRSIHINNDEIKISLDSLIVLSTLHFGDNDSTGIIAGTWYGAYQGWGKEINLKYNMKQLEFFKELDNISQNIIKKNN
jgi:ADP-ribosylarginine hydrolase